MILIVCIDDDKGMMFNQRRQSKDRVLRLRMLSAAAESRLWMNSYSESQFEEEPRDVIQVDEDPLGSAGEGEYCFVENIDPSASLEKIEKVILYKWNRAYPSDETFTLDMSEFAMSETTDFEGSSHDKITEEIYTRGGQTAEVPSEEPVREPADAQEEQVAPVEMEDGQEVEGAPEEVEDGQEVEGAPEEVEDAQVEVDPVEAKDGGTFSR